jgi:hypothetical protein
MRSRTVIIGDERQEDFDRLAAGWRAEFDFEGQAAESLLERVIREDWFLRRAEGVCMDAEAELAEVHPLERTAEQHAQMQLYLRYKTTAERSFYRAYYALRGLRKDKLKEELDFDKLRQKMDKYAVEALEKASVEREETAQARVRETGSREPRARALGAAVSRTFFDRAQRAPRADTWIPHALSAPRTDSARLKRGGCDCEVCIKAP